MSSAVHRTSTPSASIPLSQNTAPVLEFNCLYTHDIRRKQKRWQDGFLRFHTFNKRVMVYDVSRNFIGDMHWSAGEALQEGDEVMLEKDGVKVEVAESVGKTETDLTELRISAKKGKAGKGQERVSPRGGVGRVGSSIETPSRSMAPPAGMLATSNTAGNKQPRHRSLKALLGAPKGPAGKAALPSKSPFETRHQSTENEEWEEGRPPKRQRTEPWSITRTTAVATPSRPQISKREPLGARTSDVRKAASSKASKHKTTTSDGQQTLGTREVNDLSDDHADSTAAFLPGFSSDVVRAHSSPAKKQSITCEIPVARSSSPAFQTQAVKQKGPTVRSKGPDNAPPRDRDHTDGEQSIPRVSRKAPTTRPVAPLAPPFLPTSTEPGQALRISSTVPKKRTLACLDQNPANVKTADIAKPRRKTQLEQLEERLAKQRAKARAKRDDDLNALVDDIEATDNVPGAEMFGTGSRPELGRMDQMLDAALPKSSPSKPVLDREPPMQSLPPNDGVVESQQRQGRPFQRVSSEHGTAASPTITAKPKRVTSAPVRFTPSPTRRGEKKNALEKSRPEKSPMPRLKDQASKLASPEERRNPQKGIGRKEIRKSASACSPNALNTPASGTDTVLLGRPFQAPKAPVVPKPTPTEKVGPWSREAFDLFAWRPPDWDEEAWCLKLG